MAIFAGLDGVGILTIAIGVMTIVCDGVRVRQAARLNIS